MSEAPTRRKNRAYTLIELLVVVLIIGILAAVAVSNYIKTIEKNHRNMAQNTVSLIAQAVMRYHLDTSQYYAGPLSALVNTGYLSAANISNDYYDYSAGAAPGCHACSVSTPCVVAYAARKAGAPSAYKNYGACADSQGDVQAFNAACSLAGSCP